jgi:hypothetical protein
MTGGDIYDRLMKSRKRQNPVAFHWPGSQIPGVEPSTSRTTNSTYLMMNGDDNRTTSLEQQVAIIIVSSSSDDDPFS